MAATGYTSSAGDTRKVSKSGDTMTGELLLPDSSPDTSSAAASKGYVDAQAQMIGGVTVSGTPSPGHVPTATSTTSATWQAGASGTPAATVTAETSFGQSSAVGSSANYARGDHSHGTPALPTAAALGVVDPMPSDYGLLSWDFPPWAASSAGPGNSGFVYYMRVRIPSAATAAGVRLYQTAPGATLTAGQSLVGLYDTSGTRVAVSADQSTAWASGSQVNVDSAFTSPYAATAGYYWVAMLFVGSTGPSWSKGPPSGLMNAGWPSAPFLALISGSGQTSLPASVTLSSLSKTVSAFWASLY